MQQRPTFSLTEINLLTRCLAASRSVIIHTLVQNPFCPEFLVSNLEYRGVKGCVCVYVCIVS
jgi:hypothetical protein